MTKNNPPLAETTRTVYNFIQVLTKAETTGRWKHFNLQNRKKN